MTASSKAERVFLQSDAPPAVQDVVSRSQSKRREGQLRLERTAPDVFSVIVATPGS